MIDLKQRENFRAAILERKACVAEIDRLLNLPLPADRDGMPFRRNGRGAIDLQLKKQHHLLAIEEMERACSEVDSHAAQLNEAQLEAGKQCEASRLAEHSALSAQRVPMESNVPWEWEKHVPDDLIPAVQHIRKLFDEADRKCRTITQHLCYAALHLDETDLDEAREYASGLTYLKAVIGPVRTQLFHDLLKRETPSATLAAFFKLYQAAMGVQVEATFRELLEIGSKHATRVESIPMQWAAEQVKDMITGASYQIEHWLKTCCDTQSYDPSATPDEIFDWTSWRAPRFACMKPALGAPYEASRIREREDEATSLKVLRAFKEYFVLHLEGALKDSVGEALVEKAKEGEHQVAQVKKPTNEISAKMTDILRVPSNLCSSDDPVIGNPFPENDLRHRAWADASRRAEQELHVFKAAGMDAKRESQKPCDLDGARRFLIGSVGHLVTGQFDIWAKRGIQIVWSDTDAKAYGDWLDSYANAWLNQVNDFYPPKIGDIEWLLPEIRSRLIARIEFWKSEAQRYLIEQAEHQRAQVSAKPSSDAQNAKANGLDVSADFRTVRFKKKDHQLTRSQTKMFQVLYAAYEKGFPDVDKDRLLEAIENETSRVRDTWRNCALWKRLIVSKKKGTYRLEPK